MTANYRSADCCVTCTHVLRVVDRSIGLTPEWFCAINGTPTQQQLYDKWKTEHHVLASMICDDFKRCKA
jgi:hypothetical protein